jgi:hypothetical protein
VPDSPGTLCSADKHVWWRHESEMNTPVAEDRICDCGALSFARLPEGSIYVAEYHRPDGAVIHVSEGVKRSHF